MKPFFPILLLTFSLTLSASGPMVYICTGPKSECYHKTSTCRGLKKCSGDIKKISLDEAKEMRRRPCGYCYK